MEAVKKVRAATGASMTPSTTLREFLRQAQPGLGSDTFAQMTGLAEVVLYSSRLATWGHADEMKRLKDRLEEELAGEAP
jgi:hypothetical protein